MSTDKDISMMRRSLHLAAKGSYHVGTNPKVGAVITYKDKIIGEGYHISYGGPHAEIEALNSVPSEDRHRLSESHMYISLEPCFHYGKTPPCVDALLAAGIPKVSICNFDPNPLTTGKSIQKLRDNGVKVTCGLLSEEGLDLNKIFFVNQSSDLPYIILKWAQSKDGYIGLKEKQAWLSNEQSRLLVHRWREESDAIMIGTNTAILDNPKLTNRRGHGRSPIRIILDREARIPLRHHVYSDDGSSLVYTTSVDCVIDQEDKEVVHIEPTEWSMITILRSIKQRGISSVIIEGGGALLRSCIKQGLWHEARVIHTQVVLGEGVKAPLLSGLAAQTYDLEGDKIFIINNLYTHPCHNSNLVKKPLRKH